MRVLVTGAAGFIGSHVCERLVGEGLRVAGLDNFDAFYGREVKEANLAGLRGKEGFRLVEGDIRDRACVEGILREEASAGVIHLAAKAGVRGSVADPLGYEEVNVRGTLVLLEAMRQTGVKRLLFASSSSVYGSRRKLPFSERDSVDNPVSPYAATKKAGELLCHTYHYLYGMDVTCLRLFTVYGPRQRPDLAIHKFVRLMEAGQALPVYGDGSMARDFTYIDDIVDGMMSAWRECRGYQLYNLGESRPYRLTNLIAELERVLGRRAEIERLPAPPGEVRQTFADIRRAVTKLGYSPRVRLPEGLERFVVWYRQTEGGRSAGGWAG